MTDEPTVSGPTLAERLAKIRSERGEASYVNGGPVGSDTVPAWLCPGDTVITRAAAKELGLSNHPRSPHAR